MGLGAAEYGGEVAVEKGRALDGYMSPQRIRPNRGRLGS